MSAPLTRRHLLNLIGSALTLPFLPAGLHAQTLPSGSAPRQTLILYLTRTRNTEAIARMIQKHVGGKLAAIRPATPYPRDYRAHVEQVQQENERPYLPPLAAPLPDLSGYDTLFIGFPTWGMQLPPPVKTLLTETDLSGKTIIPFNTHAGYGAGNSFATIRKLCPRSRILSGLSLEGGYERRGVLFAIQGEKARAAEMQVLGWLKQHNLVKA